MQGPSTTIYKSSPYTTYPTTLRRSYTYTANPTTTYTTAAPVYTSALPRASYTVTSHTQAPVYTTAAPVYTSTAPVYTAAAPVYTSTAPVYTSALARASYTYTSATPVYTSTVPRASYTYTSIAPLQSVRYFPAELTTSSTVNTSLVCDGWNSTWGAPFSGLNEIDLGMQFDKYDDPRSGFITIDSIKRMYCDNGHQLPVDGERYLANRNKDGKISFYELCDFVYGRAQTSNAKVSEAPVFTSSTPTYRTTYAEATPLTTYTTAPVYTTTAPVYRANYQSPGYNTSGIRTSYKAPLLTSASPVIRTSYTPIISSTTPILTRTSYTPTLTRTSYTPRVTRTSYRSPVYTTPIIRTSYHTPIYTSKAPVYITPAIRTSYTHTYEPSYSYTVMRSANIYDANDRYADDDGRHDWQSQWGSRYAKLTNDELRAQFDAYDTDRSEYISFDELRNMYARSGEPLSEDAVQYLMNRYNRDHDGKVNFDEFYEFVHGTKTSAQ